MLDLHSIRIVRLLVLLVLLSSPAAADEVKGALASNAPIRWPNSTAASAYVGYGHHAVRANIAHYPFGMNALVGAAVEDEGSYSGGITDGGLSYMYFSRGLCDGAFAELGALVRRRNTSESDDVVGRVDRDSWTLSGRGMVGWSWTWDPFFLQIAVGASVGYEKGHEDHMPEFAEPSTKQLAHRVVEAEGFFRIGFLFTGT